MPVYSGSWKSTKYTKAITCGHVQLELLSKTFARPYPTNATLTYQGMYRKGEQQVFSVLVQPMGQEMKTEYVLPATVTQGQKQKGGVGTLSFLIESWSDKNELKGKYTFQHPDHPDEGTFHLREGSHPLQKWLDI